MLAHDLGSLASLRATEGHVFCQTHLYNQVEETIIDITATQFNWDIHGDDPLVKRGILVTTTPRSYHQNIVFEGSAVLEYVKEEGWYVGDPLERVWNRLVDRWRQEV